MTKRQLKRWKQNHPTRSVLDDCTVHISNVRDGSMCAIEYRPDHLMIGPFTDHSSLNTFRLGDDHYVLVAIDEVDGMVVRNQDNHVMHFPTADFVEWVVRRVLDDRKDGHIRSLAEIDAMEGAHG